MGKPSIPAESCAAVVLADRRQSVEYQITLNGDAFLHQKHMDIHSQSVHHCDLAGLGANQLGHAVHNTFVAMGPWQGISEVTENTPA
jgi:hypothetical protein